MYRNPYIRLTPPLRRPYTEIFLVRHCNPDYSLEKKVGEYNMPLSNLGLEQRKYLTKQLVALKPDKLYASGLKRAQETGALLAHRLHKLLTTEKSWDEFDWRDWHRIKYFNMSDRVREKKLKRYEILDKQLDKLQLTTRRTLADLVRRHPGRKIIVFTHGNFIKALLTDILKADVIGFLSLEIFQSSVTKIVIDRDGFVKINYINDVRHLPITPSEDLFLTFKE